MIEQPNKLSETTKHPVSISTDYNTGPVFSDDGKLILSESFISSNPIADATEFDAKLQTLLESEDYIASWHIWDCYEQDWAPIDLTLHRFEMFDLVLRRLENCVCTWRGAIDTYGRILASMDPEENEAKCWQWLRAETDKTFAQKCKKARQ